MIIYNNKNIKVLDVTVDDNSYRYRVIKGDHNLTLHYSLAEHVEIPVGSYCIYQGERYTLERPEAFKMKHSRNFEYTVTLESNQAKAKIWKFRNPVDGRLKFSLTAKPIEHLQMFVDNMNRRDTGWEVGECIDGTETLISYNHVYCWDALGMMATEFKTEFEFVGKTVHLRKVEYNKNNPLPLSYGRGNGFKPGVGRSNYGDTPPIEILYVQGGTDNIDPSKYKSSELLLPAGQSIRYDGVYFEGDPNFNSANARTYVVDDLGYSIRRSDKELTSLAEDSLDCTDIYPKRIGKVTSVVVEDADNNFYDIVDNTIPNTLNYEECLIEGETMTIVFQSGMLAGREFEVKYYHNAEKGKAARRFEIVPAEIDGQTMPNATFAPQTTDTYVVFKCRMPDAYVRDDETKTGASWDMFRTAVRYLFDNEEQKFSFTGELDGIWSKKDWINISGKIKLGGYILFSDKHFQKDGVLVRITGIKDYINKPHSPEIELSNSTVGGSFSTTLKQLESDEVLVEDYHRDAIQFTKRRFRDAKETMEMLEDALLDNFTNSINPIAIQTMQMLVGDDSLQFRFVNSKTNPVQVAHAVNYDADTKQLSAGAGIIQHLTLGITSLSSGHDVSEYKFWSVEAYESARLDDGTKKYYLYAKVNKTAETGVFVLSENAIKLEDVNGYYHLLVGILNSEYDGGRSFATLYGFSEILPGRITTDRVVSGDGNSYFDMVANAMKLGGALDFNSKGDGKLRIKGTIVQSQSGSDESYIGCYRGVYNNTYTYFNGDEVSYTYDGNTSTYRMINDTPCKGIAPTDTVYWQVVAQGSKGDKGEDGTSFNIKGTAKGHYATPNDLINASGSGSLENGDYLIDKNGSSYHYIAVYEKKPSGPTSTSYKQAEIGDAYILETDGHLYVAVENGWSDVGRIQGTSISIKGNCKGHYVNYTEMAYNAELNDYDVYILDTSFDYSEKFNNEIRKGYDTPSIITYINGPDFRFEVKEANEGDCYIDDSTGHLWQAGSDKWNDLGKIKGDNGVGVSKVEEFYLISSSKIGITISTSGWTATVQTPTKDKRYLWNYEKVTYTDGKVENTQPCIIGMYSEDGRGISSITEYYARSTSNSTSPTVWSTTPLTLTATYKYLWNYEKITYTDGTSSQTKPAVIGVYGDKGNTGDKGNYTELRFAKNGSTTTPPELNNTSLNPSGWSTTTPSVGIMEYLWMTSAVKNGAGTQLISNWTTPVRITPYDGKDGADGKSPAAVYRGAYDSTKTYYGNQYRLDVVKQGSTYYIARIDAGAFSNIAPPNTSKWNEFGAQFESIATGLLLAENANIAGWIFRNNRLESQNGTFYLDGKTGDVNIQGNFVGKISTALNGNRIVINSADNTIIMYTNKNGKDYEVLRIEGEDIGFGLLRPKLTMRELSTSDNSVMATLNISAYEIGFYRYDRTDLPFFAIQGGYSSKRIILGDLALPDSKPSTKGQLYRSGDTIKIVT